MILFYSGEGSRANPEIALGDEANLMLTFHDFHKSGNKPTSRFRRILKVRKRKANKKTKRTKRKE